MSISQILGNILGFALGCLVLFLVARLAWARFQMKHGFRAKGINGTWSFNKEGPEQIEVKK